MSANLRQWAENVLDEAPELGDYMRGIWSVEKLRCDKCGRPIYYDGSSGYYLHAGHGAVDGHNGLYCNAEMWTGSKPREPALPRVRELASDEDVAREILKMLGEGGMVP